MNYPESKNDADVYQNLINLMPKHKTYIKAFLGSGVVLRNKQKALKNIGAVIIKNGDNILGLDYALFSP